MSEDRQRWEARYRERDATERAPSDFVVSHLSGLPRGRVLDLACGDGRHALLFARHGWVVDAVDLAHAGLERLAAAARRDGLPVRPIQADLATFPLPAHRYDVVVNVRYLQRDLIEPMRRAVRPGGVVVFETFIRDQEQLGHPRNPAFLLARGELAERFHDFEQIVYAEGRFDTESGPAFLARMLARRPRQA